MIFLDLNLHGKQVATWKYRTLNRALASQRYITQEIRKAELKGFNSAKVKQQEYDFYPVYEVDSSTLRFSDGTVSQTE